MCDQNVNVDLQFIQKQFLCCVPVHKIIWSNIFDNSTWENQGILISLTVNSELVIKYPIKISYQKSFLKFLIKQFEKQGSEVHDDVYNAFGRLVALGDVSECFKHYSLSHGGKAITLKENPNIISEGTTGLCSWQASIALSEWCLTHKSRLTNKIVLELGSGVGLTGLTVALNCEPKKVYLTDCHPSVLEVLCYNVKGNIKKVEFEQQPSNNEKLLCGTTDSWKTTIEVLNLPWEGITEKTWEFRNPDLLLAADVIYDSSLFPSLINALSCFLGRQNTRELIIACTERNRATLQEFLSLLVLQGFSHEELELPEQNHFIWSTECPIRIFSVKMEKLS